MANGNNWMAVLYDYSCFKVNKKIADLILQSTCFIIKYFYICTHKNGLVAQLNSALDYGSRGYWFESSRGHNNIESS